MHSIDRKFVVGIFIVFTLLVPLQSLIFDHGQVDAEWPPARQDTLKDVQLHFHRDNSMNTNPSSANTPTASVLREGSGIEFALQPAIYADLLVKGQAKVNDQEALLLVLDTNYIPIGSSTATLTFNVIDDSTIIATNTFELPHEATFRIPFVGGKTDHTFGTGSIIKVNITASVSGQPTVRITYDHETYPGYLYVTVDQITGMSFGAFRYDNDPGEFAPNAPDNRLVRFKGDITDTFGGYDISQVVLNSASLSSFPQDAQAVILSNTDKATYYYNWTYPYGISPGPYQVLATIYDNTGNTYQDSTTITFSTYGVHLHLVEPEKSNEKGQSVVFEIEVTNIGGNQDTINLQASPSLSWSVSFDMNSIDLAPNSTGDVELTVTIPQGATDNQRNTIGITGTSAGETSKFATIDAFATALAATGFTFDLQGSSTQDIEDTETATYNLKLTNTGDITQTYVVLIDDSPKTDWTVTLEGGTPVSAGTGYIRRETVLDTNNQQNFVLRVSASNPNSFTQVVEVEAFPKNDTGNVRKVMTTTMLSIQSEVQLTPDKTVAESSVKDAADATPVYDDVKFGVNVNNLGAEVTLAFDYILPNAARDWTVTVPSEITIDENDDADVTFTILPSPGSAANEDTGIEITLSATSDDSSVTTKTNVFVKVMQFYKLEVEVEDGKNAEGGNQDIDYTINIMNLGNGDDVVSVLVVDSEWDSKLSSTTTSAQLVGGVLQIPIGAGKTSRVTLTVTTPVDAGNHDSDSLQLNIRSETFTVNDPLSYHKFSVVTTVDKSGSDAFFDSFSELLVLVVLVIAIIIIAVGISIKLKEKEREREKSE